MKHGKPVNQRKAAAGVSPPYNPMPAHQEFEKNVCQNVTVTAGMRKAHNMATPPPGALAPDAGPYGHSLQ
eukprot:357725-Chlamydomonas_euryale.AAC.4